MLTRNINKILDNNFCFPIIVLLWGLISIFYAEKLPANEGLGWDGYKYAQLTRDLLNSPIIDSYYIYRIFPGIIIHAVFDFLSIDFSNANIIRAFEFLNLTALLVATYTLKLILIELKISANNQLLAFSFFILSHPVLKYVFYYPVLTDAPAICLGALVLYFYLTRQSINLILTMLIATFTLPLLFFLGVILLAFPRQAIDWQPCPKPILWLFTSAAVLFIASIIYYWALVLKVDYDFPFTLQVDQDLIYISIAFALIPYFFCMQLINNRNFISLKYWQQTIKPTNLLTALLVYLAFSTLANYLNFAGKQSGYLTSWHTFSTMAVSGIVRPGIFFTSLFSYFGLPIILLILFWKSFCKQITQFGVGLPLALLFIAIMFSTSAQSRVFNSLFVWLIVLLVYTLNSYNFSKLFYGSCIFLSFVISRVWLPVRYGNSPVNTDGTIGFPNQKFLMNYGLWVSEYVWFIQLIAFLATLLFFVFLLFKIKIRNITLILEKRYI